MFLGFLSENIEKLSLFSKTFPNFQVKFEFSDVFINIQFTTSYEKFSHSHQKSFRNIKIPIKTSQIPSFTHKQLPINIAFQCQHLFICIQYSLINWPINCWDWFSIENHNKISRKRETQTITHRHRGSIFKFIEACQEFNMRDEAAVVDVRVAEIFKIVDVIEVVLH